MAARLSLRGGPDGPGGGAAVSVVQMEEVVVREMHRSMFLFLYSGLQSGISYVSIPDRLIPKNLDDIFFKSVSLMFAFRSSIGWIRRARF